MNPSNNTKRLFLIGFLLFFVFINLVACDSQIEATDNKSMVNTTPVQEVVPITTAPEIENKSYLFDVSNHSIEELETLLVRAEEVSQTHPSDFEDLEIVMVIHGPDIDWFTNQNHAENRQLIELAARLDAYDVIDMKVCETTMSMRGVERQDIPAFIESVPYAPTEIKQRLEQGYINL
jgi:uncharacterized protein